MTSSNDRQDGAIDPFRAVDSFESGSGQTGIYRLARLEELGLCRVAELPFSIRVQGGFTRHLPDGELMTVFDASRKYCNESVPLPTLAGAEYGSGSSRDWAAQGAPSANLLLSPASNRRPKSITSGTAASCRPCCGTCWRRPNAMKLIPSTARLFYVYAALAVWMALYCLGPVEAQVETIEPNPTQPFDIDTDFGYGPTNGRARFGRGPVRPGQPREENPAETMLREIEGTNYGHYTGRVVATTIRGGRPENRWRYRFYRGRWWYWTSARRWSHFDGRRWMP